LAVIGIGSLIGIHLYFAPIFPNIAISSIISVIVTIFITKFVEKILDLFFGKEGPFIVSLDTDQIETVIADAHKKDKEEARRKELESQIKTHYKNDLLPVMRGWFQPSEKVNLKVSGTSYDYGVLTVGIRFQLNGNSRIKELVEPRHFQQNIVTEVVEHLSKGYSEEWEKWIKLKNDVKLHLKSALQVMEEVETNIKKTTLKLGFIEWNLKGVRPTDYCHIDIFVKLIWDDPEYHQHTKRHIWDDYEIKSENGAWQFGDILAYSQRRETLEQLKRCLNAESSRITGFKLRLSEEKSKLEGDSKVFKSFLENIEDDYLRRDKWIRSSCATCKDFLEELERLDA